MQVLGMIQYLLAGQRTVWPDRLPGAIGTHLPVMCRWIPHELIVAVCADELDPVTLRRLCFQSLFLRCLCSNRRCHLLDVIALAAELLALVIEFLASNRIVTVLAGILQQPHQQFQHVLTLVECELALHEVGFDELDHDLILSHLIGFQCILDSAFPHEDIP